VDLYVDSITTEEQKDDGNLKPAWPRETPWAED
jgi:hypothetical protein